MDSFPRLSKTWFLTGEKVLFTGIYKILDHIESTHDCPSSPENDEIKLEKGQYFPVHKPCNKEAIWRLIALK